MSTGRRHAAALLDAQEQAMEQTETALAEMHRLLSAQNGAVRSWRMRLMQWHHRVTIVDKNGLDEDTARRIQMLIDELNDMIESINDELEDPRPDDTLDADLSELITLMQGKDELIDLDELKQSLHLVKRQLADYRADMAVYRVKHHIWILNLDDYQRDYQRYQKYVQAMDNYQASRQAYQKNVQELAAYEDRRAAYEQQTSAYARYQDELAAWKRVDNLRRDHRQALGGMQTHELAALLNANGPTVSESNGLLAADQSGLAQIVDAAIAQYAPTGAMPLLPVFSLYGMTKDDLAPVDAGLNYGDWDEGRTQLTAVFKSHVDRVLAEFNQRLQALKDLPKIKRPRPVSEPEPLSKAPQPMKKPVLPHPVPEPQPLAEPERPARPHARLETLEYDPHWIPANAVDADLIEQLDAYARGPYANTNEHLDAINDLAERLGHGCPTIADHRHDWDDAWEQSGLSDALDAVFDSHAAFGSQRHSTHGSRLIDRLMSATEALYAAKDRRSLRNAERRFQTARLDMLAWWQTRWTERGGTPENDNTYKKWQPTSGIAPLK